MFRMVMPALLAMPFLLSSPMSFADECEDAARTVKREAREASLPPAEFAKITEALDQALERRKSGDDIGCLSMVEAARAMFAPM
jgi:hypothetical protein